MWSNSNKIPLSLYVHFPWCLRKCPYCDFNSYPAKEIIPETTYLQKLEVDLLHDLAQTSQRKLHSIFIGGGTPSLLTVPAIANILKIAETNCGWKKTTEITVEANPGTIDKNKLLELRSVGVNRISLGVQSFNDVNLHNLSRIHDKKQAIFAIEAIQHAGFDNFNLDLMYGLPAQSVESALTDLKIALEFAPKHISWYQLTIEPETKFFQQGRKAAAAEQIWEMEEQGRRLLADNGFAHYEISAYAKDKFQCKHNLNYWQFGDYIGIGPGAHGKLSLPDGKIWRNWKVAEPEEYLQAANMIAGTKMLTQLELPFEFMLNALRLYSFIPYSLFAERTGLQYQAIAEQLEKASAVGFLEIVSSPEPGIVTTQLGKNFLNELLELFLP